MHIGEVTEGVIFVQDKIYSDINLLCLHPKKIHFKGTNAWALKTLNDHRKDKREKV